LGKYVTQNGFTIDTPEEFWKDIRESDLSRGDPFFRSREYVEESFAACGDTFLQSFERGMMSWEDAGRDHSGEFVKMVHDFWCKENWGGASTGMISLEDARRILMVNS
jgi:hypothetical protein